MSLATDLKKFAKQPLEYWCRAHDDEGKEHKGKVPVTHILEGAAIAKDIELAKKLLGKYAKSVIDLAKSHNGFLLYRGYSRDQAGFRMLPIAKWPGAKRDLKFWLEEFTDEDDIHHLRTGIPIAEVPCSGNYFIMPIEGKYAGQIIFFDHDGCEREVYAKNFDAFIRRVIKPTELVKGTLNGVLVYIEPKTRLQWNVDKVAK